MTVNIGNTLPVQIGTKSASKANSDDNQSTFKDVLGDNGRRAGAKHAAPHPNLSRDTAARHMTRDSELNYKVSLATDQAAEEIKGGKILHFQSVTGKAVHMDDDAADAPPEKPKTISDNTAHERLPLLMSLQEINRAAAFGEEQGLTKPGLQAAAPNHHHQAEEALADIDLPSVEEKVAGTDPIRNTEAQQTKSKATTPTAVFTEPLSEPDTSADDGVTKPSFSGATTETVRASSTSAPNDHAPRPQMQERVAIVSAQSFPAPAMPDLNSTTSRLVTAIASDSGLKNSSSSSVFTPATAHQAPVAAHTLKIELHPAELGVVNAHLRLTGEQLSIELRPDTQEAYHRLSSDSDTITKALRDLGLDVGKVTVLQPAIAATPTTRSDTANPATAAPDRDTSSFQSGQSGSNGNGPGEQRSGRSRENDAYNADRAPSTGRDRTGSGVFI